MPTYASMAHTGYRGRVSYVIVRTEDNGTSVMTERYRTRAEADARAADLNAGTGIPDRVSNDYTRRES